MPQIVIVAGPNGAGKTSFANELLPGESGRFVYVNADEIARQLTGTGAAGAALDLTAGRRMLAEMKGLVEPQAEFVAETTLATMAYATLIPQWRQAGYTVSLVYLRLPSVEASLARVRKRVEAGGHSIPEDVIRRRFPRSLDHLERVYKPIVDDWCVYDSLDGSFRFREARFE